jgi:hypothetical protein
MAIPHAEYLGDGLFANFDGWQVELYTHDGYRATNRVSLEPMVLQLFLAWLHRTRPETMDYLMSLQEEPDAQSSTDNDDADPADDSRRAGELGFS